MPIKREGGSSIVSCLPSLDPATGLLPPGRYAATLDELYSTLVVSTGSAIRREIWEEWSTHRTMVETQVGEISRMWVGGSFVSNKLDPSDVDVTYLVSAHHYDALDQETLVDLDDLTDAGWCADVGMRVDALILRLPKRLPVSQMAPRLLDRETSESFRDLGLYDEVCQAIKPPAAHSVPSELRRGYVEVLL
ncbi:DUF6932 family protein [Streptomyces sp. NPDC014776]|uniref:DUF6932 family protein n=1 Tax=Streptomyces sp. NPDC014776 TaxID=3364909 RepID=UPI0036FF9ABC